MGILDQSFYETNATGCLGYCRESSHPVYTSSAHHAPLDERQLLTQEDRQKKQELDTMLSEAFNNLTFEERQIHQEQLHGVADEIVEDPSLVQDSLRELESFLWKTKAGRAYETAESQDPEYVNSRSLRISFLRSDEYNVKAAADRMLRFFDEKQKLFGTEKLTKDITIDDLDQDDIVVLKSGVIQWAGTDRSRRAILLQLPGLRKNYKLKSELRARYFLMMEALKSSETQLRGTVALVYSVGDFKDHEEGRGYLEHSRLSTSIPLYLGAFHKACDDMKQYVIGKAIVGILPAKQRTRFRLHFGTHLECQYRLASYGIPIALLPLIPETNAVDLEPHLQWCNKHILSSHADGTRNELVPVVSSCIGAITEPNPNDVLSAGSAKSDNLGNDRLRVLVKECQEVYRTGSLRERRQIVDRIISAIHQSGGRFLRKEKGSQTWTEMPASKARMRITQRFRNQSRQRESAWQQAQEGTLIADIPRPNDVIFGRKTQRNRGTELLHQLIKEKSQEYDGLDRKMKIGIVNGVIERIQSEGGRFLQPSRLDNGGYAELSIDSIRDRISTYFRNNRRGSKSTSTVMTR